MINLSPKFLLYPCFRRNRVDSCFLHDLLNHFFIQRVSNFVLEFIREVSIVHLNQIIVDSLQFLYKLYLSLEVTIELRTIPNSDEKEDRHHQKISCCVNHH